MGHEVRGAEQARAGTVSGSPKDRCCAYRPPLRLRRTDLKSVLSLFDFAVVRCFFEHCHGG
jgi:hypothetical protein